MADVIRHPFAWFKECPKCKNSVGDARIEYGRQEMLIDANGEYMNVGRVGGPDFEHLLKRCQRCGFEWLEHCADAPTQS